MIFHDPVTENGDWEEEMIIPEATLKYGDTGSCFVCFSRPEGSFSTGMIQCTLKFFFKDIDSVSGDVSHVSVEDEYMIDKIEITEADFVNTQRTIGMVEFRQQWQKIKENNVDDYEAIKKYSL